MARSSDRNDKIGSGHLRAMGKQGLAELRAAFYPGSNIAQPTEYGIFGRETPGEVSAERGAEPARDEEKSVLAKELREARARLATREKPRDRGMGREE